MRLYRHMVLVAAVSLLAVLGFTSTASAGRPGQNGKVIFNSFNNCCDRIWTVNPDGTDLRVIHLATSQYARLQDVSPDGKNVLFLDTGGTGSALTFGPQIRSTSIATGGLGTLLDWPQHFQSFSAVDGFARYSPDGARVGFIRITNAPDAAGVRESRYQVWVMDTDGTHQQQLFERAAALGDLAWSADGTRLSYVDSGLTYSIPADATAVPVPELAPFSSPGLSPISPDGTKQVFVDCCDADTGGTPEVYVSNPDGSGRQRLTDVYPDCQGVLPYCGFFAPFQPGQNQEAGFVPFNLLWQTLYPATSRTGLVAAYNFDGGTGSSVVDLSGNENTGTTRATTWTTGLHGGALAFNGVSSWVTIADRPSLNLTSAMTLEAWVRPTQLTDGAWKSVIFKEQKKTTAYDLYASNGKVPATSIWNGREQLAKGSSQLLPLDRWNHLAATLGGGTLRLYVNGNLIATKANSGSIVRDRSAKPLRIGGNSVFDEFFAGSIDDVRIYNRALSDAELRSDMFTPVA